MSNSVYHTLNTHCILSNIDTFICLYKPDYLSVFTYKKLDRSEIKIM
jgi:hypothetical protein